MHLDELVDAVRIEFCLCKMLTYFSVPIEPHLGSAVAHALFSPQIAIVRRFAGKCARAFAWACTAVRQGFGMCFFTNRNADLKAQRSYILTLCNIRRDLIGGLSQGAPQEGPTA
jgi:hypothetical protein